MTRAREENIQIFNTMCRILDPEIKEESLRFLAGHLEEKEFPKNSFLIKTNSTHDRIYFIASGLVRGYYIDSKGSEITIRLIEKGGFATHYSAFLARIPSDYYFQALDKTIALSFSFDHIQDGYKRYPDLQRFGRYVAEFIINILEERIRSFQFFDGRQRYLNFLHSKGHLMNAISVTHLSSYLGLTRPSLSRIRSQIWKK